MGMVLEEMGQLLYVMHRAFGLIFFSHLPQCSVRTHTKL